MTKQEIITKATEELRSENGFHFLPDAIAKTVEEGLQDGDKVAVGGFVYAQLIPDAVVIFQRENTPEGREKEVKRIPLAEVSQDVLDVMLKCKAKRAAKSAVRK